MQNTLATELLFELSEPGCRAAIYPDSDVPDRPVGDLVPEEYLADSPANLPELSEPEIVRHFVNLSAHNMSVDTHFYPLGSCTMKYNPKRNERLAALSGLCDVHPFQTEKDTQGLLELLYELQKWLAELSGLPGVSLQPAAGAHGELTAMMVAAAYFRDTDQNRTKVLFPSSAHGTNPASATTAGFDCLQLQKSCNGLVDLDELKQHLDDTTAVFMITNPNTLGLFETEIATIAQMLHDVGALLYIDGANMNAILGITRPGDFGGDMMHFNVHKTFTGPHGAGGPGAGPIAVRSFLADYLPGPIVARSDDDDGDADEEEDDDDEEEEGGSVTYELVVPPKSIGRVRTFLGNVGVLVRGYCYLRTLGADGLRSVSEHAVLNANYVLSKISDLFPAPHGDRCMHEFVSSAQRLKQERGISAMDIAKRLLDYGFHAPTIYFPLDVPEAIMIEPTETESKRTLDAFVQALQQIAEEDPEFLHVAPHTTPISRPNDVQAARKPILKWTPPSEQ